MREWLQNGDIFVIDRGYRDALPWLEEVGINCWMPKLLENGQHQLSTEDANLSRIVTKNSWIVEARNGHFRSIFKFFAGTIIMPHLHNLHDFYRIGAAIINKYYPLIIMENTTIELAREMIRKIQVPNLLQNRLEAETLGSDVLSGDDLITMQF